MKKLIIILGMLFIINPIYSQSSEEVNIGGYLYPAPEVDVLNSLKYCPKGSIVTSLGRYKFDKRFIEVMYKNTQGFMYYSAIKNSDKITALSESKKIEISEKIKVSSSSNGNIKKIKLNKTYGNTYIIPCEVNGLKMDFIFDTGASEVSISLTEALFMFKNGYLKESDITGTQNYSIANGDIVEGTTIIIRKLEFEGVKLYNIKASISHEMKAPLLLGQSALSQLGKIQIDYKNDILTIIKD